MHPNRDDEVLNEVKNYYYNRCPEDNSTQLPTTPAATRPTNCGSPEEQRNTIIYDLKSIIDENYEKYARNFQQTADITTFVGEVGAAALTAVGTLVGASDLKDILTTASTLTQSTNVSIQKNFYQKQTEYAILAEMDADRAKQWLIIVNLMKQPVSQYLLSAALNDLQEYKRAGTATAALTEMTQQAGATTDTAKQQTRSARGGQGSSLSISVTHTGNFRKGQQNTTYSVTVSNAANASATSGAVTVAETVPAGLTLVSMTGDGWGCTESSCTRSNALNGGSSYPAITVTVNVSDSASSPLVNQVTVSGGGSASSSASDSTTIM